MESQMQRPIHEADPHTGLHTVAEGEGEKKSVLKKVKDKAKKIKDTIKKHGHGHDHDNEPEHGYDEDDEDVEMLDDPEIHGAPMYDSNVIPSTNLPKQVDVNLEKPSDPREDRYNPMVRDETYPKVRHEGISGPVGLVETVPEFPSRTHHEPEMPHNTRLAKPDIEYPKPHIAPIWGLEEEPHVSKTRPEFPSKTHIPEMPHIEPHASKTRPDFSSQTHVPEMPHNTRLGKPDIDYPKPHDAPIGGLDEEFHASKTRPEFPSRTHEPEMPHNTRLAKPDIEYPKSHIAPIGGLEEDPHALKTRHEQVPISNYESKVNDPTGQGGAEASVDPLVRQLKNLDVAGHGSESKHKQEQASYTGSHDQFAPQPTPTIDEFPNSPKRFDSTDGDQTMPRDTVAGKISAATSAITGTAISAKNVVASKLGYGGAQNQAEPVTEPTPTKDEFSPKRSDTTDGDQTMPQGTVAGKLSAATSAITGGAISAKNVVASKLGYGGAQNQAEPATESPKKPGMESPKKPLTETATEYAHLVGEKLAPVYGKVAGAGTAVVSSVTGGGKTEGQVGEKTTDKGVSVKEYWTEKLRPGDEDRALSEAITDALHKKKEPGAGEGSPVMGKVTESEEVRTRLGTGKENPREGEDAVAAGNEGVGSGQGIADKVKGAVSSWLGKSAGVQTAQDAVGQSYVSGTGSQQPDEGVGRGGDDAVHGANR